MVLRPIHPPTLTTMAMQLHGRLLASDAVSRCTMMTQEYACPYRNCHRRIASRGRWLILSTTSSGTQYRVLKRASKSTAARNVYIAPKGVAMRNLCDERHGLSLRIHAGEYAGATRKRDTFDLGYSVRTSQVSIGHL